MYKSIEIYTKPRCHVSVYRTTGPLVLFMMTPYNSLSTSFSSTIAFKSFNCKFLLHIAIFLRSKNMYTFAHLILFSARVILFSAREEAKKNYKHPYHGNTFFCTVFLPYDYSPYEQSPSDKQFAYMETQPKACNIPIYYMTSLLFSGYRHVRKIVWPHVTWHLVTGA